MEETSATRPPDCGHPAVVEAASSRASMSSPSWDKQARQGACDLVCNQEHFCDSVYNKEHFCEEAASSRANCRSTS
jgi:hypothetical protein